MGKVQAGARPIGAIDDSPLIVKTVDLARFVRPRLGVNANGSPTYEKMIRQIKNCKARGQIIHGMSYEVLKRIIEENAVTTSDTCADELLIACDIHDVLGKDVPLFRNPNLTTAKYVRLMKDRLQDEEWNEEIDMEFIKSFPELEQDLPL